MAGEKARVTEQIINRIHDHVHEDTEVYVENFKESLNRQILDYDRNQAEALKRKLEKKESDSGQNLNHLDAERGWKVQTALREVKTKQINELREKARKRLLSLLGSDSYVEYLNLARSKAPTKGVYYVRSEDLEHFKDVETKVSVLPLGGFKVVDGSKIIDFTLETAFKEVFDAFSNTLNIEDGQE